MARASAGVRRTADAVARSRAVRRPDCTVAAMRRLQASGKPPAWRCEHLELAIAEKPDIRGMHLAWRHIAALPGSLQPPPARRYSDPRGSDGPSFSPACPASGR